MDIMKMHLLNFPGRRTVSTCFMGIILLPMLSNINDAIYIGYILIMYLKTGISYIIILRIVNRNCIEYSKENRKKNNYGYLKIQATFYFHSEKLFNVANVFKIPTRFS